MQEKLKIASEKYGDLETEHKEEVLRNQELLEKKDECIALLKRELEVANDVLESSRHETLSKHMEGSDLFVVFFFYEQILDAKFLLQNFLQVLQLHQTY